MGTDRPVSKGVHYRARQRCPSEIGAVQHRTAPSGAAGVRSWHVCSALGAPAPGARANARMEPNLHPQDSAFLAQTAAQACGQPGPQPRDPDTASSLATAVDEGDALVVSLQGCHRWRPPLRRRRRLVFSRRLGAPLLQAAGLDMRSCQHNHDVLLRPWDKLPIDQRCVLPRLNRRCCATNRPACPCAPTRCVGTQVAADGSGGVQLASDIARDVTQLLEHDGLLEAGEVTGAGAACGASWPGLGTVLGTCTARRAGCLGEQEHQAAAC